MSDVPASPDIRHVVVLMLENRSFDCMLGMLYPKSTVFDGLDGTETNLWHGRDGTAATIHAWSDPTLSAQSVCIPDPDPGELFTDIHMQIHGLTAEGTPNVGPTMAGFVDNYMRQPPTNPARDPHAVMHYFMPDQVPVISELARAFGVSDRWHASAPCQTWPNRFFAHTGTADGYINNSPTHFPYIMETVFNRLRSAGQSWRIYFHDIPQSATLARLWEEISSFRHFEEDFPRDASSGRLPADSFIEPRYFADILGNRLPNDEHPPHNVAYGEELIAAVYNAVRAGPGWKQTLLIVTYDEHGGCFDHVVPPPATPPDNRIPDGFRFDYFGIRVPALIVSPYVQPGSIIRPAGLVPFDHTSIISTLRMLFGFAPLTNRDSAAPDLLPCLGHRPDNDGPESIRAQAVPPVPAQIARSAARPLNDLQRSLASAAVQLPTAGANITAHIDRLLSTPDVVLLHPNVGSAAEAVAGHMKAFLAI